MLRRRLTTALLCLTALVAGLLAPAAPAAALDVYTTPGTHDVNGRLWRTSCEKYSSSIERCRTEIKATTISYSAGRYVETTGWAFNNLTYKPSPRAQWVGNPLATPGDHLSGGRQWRTECDTAWTGINACRSSILTTTYRRTGSGYSQSSTWVFNNIVRFSNSLSTNFCVPAVASRGISDGDPEPPVAAAESAPAAPSAAATLPGTTPEATPTATPTPTPTPAVTATPTPTPALPPTPIVSPSLASSAAPTAPSAPGPAAAPDAAPIVPAASTVTLGRIHHPSYPTGVLYDRLGPIQVEGAAPDAAEVRVELLDATGKVRSSVVAPVARSGAFTASIAGGFAGAATIRATAGAASGSRAVELRKAGILTSAPTNLDPLATAQFKGTVTPGIGNLLVTAYVSTPAGWLNVGSARTTGTGAFAIPVAYGRGNLASQQVRACATLPWGPTIPAAAASTITRARIANAVITNTTTADVASTYRAGCPVGPSALSTIRINQQSMDGTVYRGEIVVRRARAAEVARVFTKAFEGGFPVYQMTNPNAFSGNDVAMMAANNTSAFNCRKVVGNPYAMSPHSYGYAVDLNPWQNPYRDPKGRWYPSTAHVSRTPVVPGMLTSSSIPVKEFKAQGWQWFSGWDWHHFEKR